jgi:hypothetical protein
VHVKVETRNAYTWVWKHDHDCPVAFSPAYKTCEEQPAGCYGAEHVYNPWDLRTICPYDDWWVVPDAARGNRRGTRILHDGARSTCRICRLPSGAGGSRSAAMSTATPRAAARPVRERVVGSEDANRTAASAAPPRCSRRTRTQFHAHTRLGAGKCLNPYYYADVLFGVRPTEVKCEDEDPHHHEPEVVLSSSKFYASYDQKVKDDCQ